MCRRFIRQIAHKFCRVTSVCQEILGNMTDEDAVQTGGRRFLEVPFIKLMSLARGGIPTACARAPADYMEAAVRMAI